MNASPRSKNKRDIANAVHGGRKNLLPALLAIGGGCGLFASSATALELGEIRIQSALGQPLRASVAYALQPNEQIHDYCIYLKPGLAAHGLPSISNAAITVTGDAIHLRGTAAIREPLLALQLTVDCPYTAHLRRDYSVLVDPLPQAQPRETLHAAAPAAASAASAAIARPQRPAATAQSPAERPVAHTPIRSSESYRVEPGDTLSGIAQRISGRTVGIWPAADAIFAANPDAFMNNDPNRLRAGSVLAIPDAIRAPRTESRAASVSAAAQAPARAQDYSAYEPAANTRAVEETRAAQVAAGSTAAATVETVRTPEPATATPRPGDVLLDSDSPFVSPVDVVAEPRATATPASATREIASQRSAGERSPAVRTSGATTDSFGWLIWLAGSGVALILALLLFGRSLKGRFLPSAAQEEAFSRRRTDGRDLDDTDVSPILGLPSQGTAPVARKVTLDADLEDGSGFQYGGDIDVAQDFGFSDDSGQFRSGLDIDLTEGTGTDTDVIAPHRAEEATIIVSETPPQRDDTNEYDLSMIVDATKQVVGDSDATTKDLRAIQVDADEDADTVSEEYTLSREIDYKILEQDYEDELTATQALNAELAKAAQALSSQYGKDEMGDTLSEETGELSAPVFGASSADDATTALPLSDAAHSGDETAEIPPPAAPIDLADTANDADADALPPADNDATIEVEVESAMIDTRKMRA